MRTVGTEREKLDERPGVKKLVRDAQKRNSSLECVTSCTDANIKETERNNCYFESSCH